MTGRWMALLLVVVAVCGVGRALSGTWSGEVSLLPAPALRSVALSLVYTAPPWSVASRSEFSSVWGWVWQEFEAAGQFGPLGIEGTALFGPLIPDFLYAQVVAKAEFGGVRWGAHTALLGPALGGSLGGAVITASVPNGQGALTATVGFGASLPTDGFAIWHVSGLSKTYATDPRPGGLRFTQAEISLTGLSLCCGIIHDLELSFTKAGFQHVEFAVKGLPLCCGIRLDAAAKFTVKAKQLSLAPHWEGVGTACFVLYGDVLYQPATQTWEGIEIYGWKIRCDLGPCRRVEFLTALAHREDFWLLPDGTAEYDQEPPPPAGAEPLFQPGEFEYLGLAFCGPACCGQSYAVSIGVFFGNGGGLFAVTRVRGSAAFPVMANFRVLVNFIVPAAAGAGAAELRLGWLFSF